MSLSLGPIEVDPPVVLAPMAGITNAPFRSLCRRFGAGLYVSEMLGARAIVEGDSKTLELAEFGPDDDVRSIQLYATDAGSAGEAVRRLVSEGRVDHVDFNFGCPAPKITRHGGGAVLPYKRRLFESIVASAVEAAGDVPVTVKFRKGINDSLLTYVEAGRIAESCGAAAVALHARTAEQLYSGSADWPAITRLKQAVTTIPVLGNGDIWVADDAVRMMDQTGCDGVVVGRGCLGRPWLFRELAEAFAGVPQTPAPDLAGVVEIMVEHAQLLVDWFGEFTGIRSFRKHTSWYLKGFVAGRHLRSRLHLVESVDELQDGLAGLDLTQAFPAEAARMVRGHSHGPRPVKLPYGYLDDPDDIPHLSAAAAVAVSGG
ncbi:MAG: tRNA dihydrouridine synthase DusB [Acidimicrobiia bacterium]|nr:tRNA dihydrouridine synthase DusB [Acidimicrobiia bacterium]